MYKKLKQLIFDFHNQINRFYQNSDIDIIVNKLIIELITPRGRKTPVKVYISYRNYRDAQRYSITLIRNLKGLPMDIKTIVRIARAYPAPSSVCFVGFSFSDVPPTHTMKLSATGINYLSIVIA